MGRDDKPLVWLHGEILTPPFSEDARREAGFEIRKLQEGEKLSMPISRPMPNIGRRCHELRIIDSEENKTWRVVYRIDPDAILILEVFAKKKKHTPVYVVKNCKRTLRLYDS